MGGDIVLDESYDSGLAGSPGARFVIYTNRSPLVLDDEEKDNVMESFESSGTSIELSPEAKIVLLPEQCSVLFCDDDTLLRRLFSRSLSKVKPKWTIQEAANGETAIELVTKNGHYDIIFMGKSALPLHGSCFHTQCSFYSHRSRRHSDAPYRSVHGIANQDSSRD